MQRHRQGRSVLLLSWSWTMFLALASCWRWLAPHSSSRSASFTWSHLSTCAIYARHTARRHRWTTQSLMKTACPARVPLTAACRHTRASRSPSTSPPQARSTSAMQRSTTASTHMVFRATCSKYVRFTESLIFFFGSFYCWTQWNFF